MERPVSIELTNNDRQIQNTNKYNVKCPSFIRIIKVSLSLIEEAHFQK